FPEASPASRKEEADDEASRAPVSGGWPGPTGIRRFYCAPAYILERIRVRGAPSLCSSTRVGFLVSPTLALSAPCAPCLRALRENSPSDSCSAPHSPQLSTVEPGHFLSSRRRRFLRLP